MQFQLSIFHNSFNRISLLRYEFILEFPQFHNSTIPQFYEFSTIPQTCNFTFAQVCTFPLISRTNMPQYHLAGFYTPAHRHNIYTQFENSICARVILPSHFTVPYLSIEKNTTTH